MRYKTCTHQTLNSYEDQVSSPTPTSYLSADEFEVEKSCSSLPPLAASSSSESFLEERGLHFLKKVRFDLSRNVYWILPSKKSIKKAIKYRESSNSEESSGYSSQSDCELSHIQYYKTLSSCTPALDLQRPVPFVSSPLRSVVSNLRPVLRSAVNPSFHEERVNLIQSIIFNQREAEVMAWRKDLESEGFEMSDLSENVVSKGDVSANDLSKLSISDEELCADIEERLHNNLVYPKKLSNNRKSRKKVSKRP